MSKGSRHLRTHIRAAQEWLGRADHSLRKQEDVKGDLQLMLAQAEMQRAREIKPATKRQRCLYRLLPLATAIFLCVVVFLLYGGQAVQPTPVLPKTAPAIAVTTKTPPLPTADDAKESAVLQPASPVQAKAGVMSEERAPDSKNLAAEPAGSRQQTVSKPEPSPAVASVPSRHMQNLMRSAGDTLRKQ